jgi:hypothetical protein
MIFSIHSNRIFLSKWHQKQSYYAMKWGTSGVEDEEQDRPLFTGDPTTSPITGGGEYFHFPDSEKSKRERNACVSLYVLNFL